MTAAPTQPLCLNCGCPWDSCLVHSDFCCDACAHFAAPTGPEPRTDAAMELALLLVAKFPDYERWDWLDVARVALAAGRERDIRHDRTEGETT